MPTLFYPTLWTPTGLDPQLPAMAMDYIATGGDAGEVHANGCIRMALAPDKERERILSDERGRRRPSIMGLDLEGAQLRRRPARADQKVVVAADSCYLPAEGKI